MDTATLAVIAVVIGLFAAALVGRFAGALGRALGLLDFPDYDGGRKRHAAVTPLVGGLAVAVPTLAATLLALTLGENGPDARLHLAWLGAALAVMFGIGFADDRFSLSPTLRLLAAVVMLSLVAAYAHDFSVPMLRFAGQERLWLLVDPWGAAFALLCLVGLLNAVNMADGKNGVVIGMALIWSASLAFRLPAPFTPVLAGAAAALSVTFAHNLRGRLFLGDAGSYFISALFGLLAIVAYNHDFAAMRADDVAVLFAVPVFDTIRLMAVRALAGRSPFDGDRDHLHHHLHRALGWPRGLWSYLLLVGVPNAGALLLPGTGLVWLGVTLLGYAGALAATRGRIERPA